MCVCVRVYREFVLCVYVRTKWGVAQSLAEGVLIHVCVYVCVCVRVCGECVLIHVCVRVCKMIRSRHARGFAGPLYSNPRGSATGVCVWV